MLKTSNLTLVAYFIAAALATPSPRVTRPSWSSSVLAQCETAVNCEIVNGHPVIDFTHVGVVHWMQKRQSDGFNTTTVTANTGMLDMGTDCGPTPHDMVHDALYNSCGWGGCRTDESTFQCKQPSSAIVFGGPATVTCIVTQDGAYPSSGIYFPNLLIPLIEATVQQTTTQQSHTIWVGGFPKREQYDPTNSQVTFTTNMAPTSVEAVHSTVIEGQSVLVGTMRYAISCSDPSDQTSCSDILGGIQSFGALLGPLVPESESLDLVLDVLGAISAVC